MKPFPEKTPIAVTKISFTLHTHPLNSLLHRKNGGKEMRSGGGGGGRGEEGVRRD